jgi:hypothetical protein
MFNKKDLTNAKEAGIINTDQLQNLVQYLESNSTGKINFSNALFYFGGLLGIFAMSIFMVLAFTHIKAYGTLILSFIYFAGALKYSFYLHKNKQETPASVLATFALTNVPLFFFSMFYIVWGDNFSIDHDYKDFFRVIDSWWLLIEVATISIGLWMLSKLKHSFLMMPIALCTWFLSMDIVDLIFNTHFYEHMRISSLLVGSIMTIAGIYIDYRNKTDNDYSIWLYVFGLVPAWLNLVVHFDMSEIAKFFIFLTNIFLILFGVAIKRKIFIALGSIGSYLYVSRLAFDIFKDQWFLFSLFLIVTGFLLIQLGIYCKNNSKNIEKFLNPYLPTFMKIIAKRK